MEEETRPIRQQQRRLNQTVLDVVKKEVTKLLVAGIFYPILDSQWVSLVQVVPNKSRMTVMKNQHDELENPITCFLDGFFGYMKIHIAPEDQHKTTFTYPFGTFAYTRMSFGLFNAPMTKGIVLGHPVSNRGIKIDKSKIDIITSLPNPAYVWEVRSFLGHSGLLPKDVEFNFDQPCIEVFHEMKNRFTSTPILQAPNWDYPFELMCDTSNSALGAVLGQRARVGKPMHVIAYASRTMDPTQLNYTIIEKELLAIVFALDKFRPYLLGSKIIVFSDHDTL
ncbi:Retrovirus-related Pol polyprotein, partial [Mucuna pruriens]